MPKDGEIKIDPVRGADQTLLVWGLDQISVNNAAGNDNPFRDSFIGERDVKGSSFTINPDGAPQAVGIKDNDRFFNDNDRGQTLVSTTTIDGVTEQAGKRLTPEYAYSVKDSKGNIIKIFVVELKNNDAVGFVTDKPMVLGETYTFIKLKTNLPIIKYKKLADSFIDPDGDNNQENNAVVIDEVGSALVVDAVDTGTTQDATGTILFSDADPQDVHLASASFVSSTAGTQFGSFTADVTTDTTGTGTGGIVTYNFGIDDAAAASLPTDCVTVETYEVFIDDGNGSVESTLVTVTFGPPGAIIAPAEGGNINGTAADELILGRDGNDIIVAQGGDDTIYGKGGDDFVLGNTDSDTLFGGEGSDDLRGGAGEDIVDGGAGTDTVNGDAGVDVVSGGTGLDIFRFVENTTRDGSVDTILDLEDGETIRLSGAFDVGTGELVQSGANVNLVADVAGLERQLAVIENADVNDFTNVLFEFA